MKRHAGYTDLEAQAGRFGQHQKAKNCQTYAIGMGAGLALVGLFAGVGAAVGATGAAVLKAAGHAGYITKAAAVTTSAGASILSVPYLAVRGFISLVCNSDDSSSNSTANFIGELVLTAGIEAASAALGVAIAQSAGSNFNEDMSMGQVAASAAVGSAILSAGAAAVKACLS